MIFGLRAKVAMTALASLALASALSAQGVTTAGIRGTIRGDRGQPVDARVLVRHEATGYAIEVRASAGQFLAQGLEPGGPYTVTLRALGFGLQSREAVYVELGALRQLDFVLEPIATSLDTVVVASPAQSGSLAGSGRGYTTITAELLDRMPASNRDLYDFMRLAPQLSTKTSLLSPGFSAAGTGFRFNNFLINGASERTLSGSVSPAFGGIRSVPLAAVQEYQVLVAPYDVRYGDFAGGLVNAITRTGTNTFHGSAFAYVRNDGFAGRLAGDTSTSFQRVQYGLSLSGPIVKDRLQFLIAPELQRYTFAAAGPYVGQPKSAYRPVPVSAGDLARFDAIMRSYGLSAGSPGAVQNRFPLENLFTRLDLALPKWRSRVVAWDNYGSDSQLAFSRTSLDTFSLSSTLTTSVAQAHTTAVQLHTELPRAGGGHNEVLLSARTEHMRIVGDLAQPIVRVSVPTDSGGQIILNSGATEGARLGGFRSTDVTLEDNVTLPVGVKHVLSFGARAERFQFRKGIGPTSYGTWSFASLDDFAAGHATRYDIGIDFGTANPTTVGSQFAGYWQDQWHVSDRLTLTGGIRGDFLALDGRAPYNPAVDSIFGRRTDEMPRRRVELSPRLGFVLDSLGSDHQRLRGGLGVFTGRYPLAWAQSALQRYGVGNATLTCAASAGASQLPPAFIAHPTPTTCASGNNTVQNLKSDVNLLDPDLRLVRIARASLAYERRMPGDFNLTSEALVSRGLSDFAFQNLNLNAPWGTDPYGRVMYDTIQTTGKVKSTRRSGFHEVIDLVNASSSRSYQFTTTIERTLRRGVSGSASYTYTRALDPQTPIRVNTTGTIAWASARVLSGRDDDMTASTSSDDVRHRVVFVGNFEAPWRRARTALSLYYVGESGRPFTYTAYGADGRGDLNADGSNTNDPIYVPRNALDTTEIKFSGALAGADSSPAAVSNREHAQRSAFENFIARTPCLRRQRGQIMARNSCREPWTNTTIASLRQEVPTARRMVDVELDVFNVLNLIRSGWGLRREARPAVLQQYAQTAGPASSAQPIFQFDPSRVAWITDANESGFQVQLAARFHF